MTSTHQEWRNSQYYDFDPYSADIAPALLNSADIKKYVDAGCLIHNSQFDPERLKTASYEMKFLGKLYDWTMTKEGQLKPCCREICSGESTILYKNSISYLWMEEQLFLPEYMAARFNLHIRHVHKGLLLGTGPLVDPGFSGSLLIPLHNLTDNDYSIDGGKGIIWVEFTKLSRNEFWEISDKSQTQRPLHLSSFPDTKDLIDPSEYFLKSGVTAAGGVQSAFRGALDKTRRAATAASNSADDSRKYTERFTKIYTLAGVATGLLILLAVTAIIVQGYSLVNQVIETTSKVHQQVEEDQKQSLDAAANITKRIESIEAQLKGANAEINSLRSRLNLVQQEKVPTPNDEQ